MEAKLAAVVAYRDQNLPGKDVWWTEFGYDTYASSPLHAPALGSNSAFIVQGQWLVRDFLAALAAGDRARDALRARRHVHPALVGLRRAVRDGRPPGRPRSTPKPAWYFVATFRARLQDMVYAGAQDSGQADVKIAHFNDTTGPGGALVVWAPTSNATGAPRYSLALPAGAATAKAVALTDKQPTGVESALTPASGSVTLDVSETPTIVVYGP